MHQSHTDSLKGNIWPMLTLVIWGLILSLFAGTEGSTWWCIFRISLVLAATALIMIVFKYFPRPGSVFVVIAGAIALTIAAVFGVYHLLEAGFGWRVAAGLLSLVTGAILLYTGGRRLISGLAQGWSFLTIPAMVILILVLVWTMTPAVLATNVPLIPQDKEPPAVSGLDAREVHFSAGDGVEMAGWYIPSVNHSAVILRHGSGSTSADVKAQAAVLVKRGYGVLATDARGHGRSSGRAMDFGWYGTADIKGAVTFLTEQPDINANRIVVIGLSMGGEEAIGAMAEDPRIAAVVAEGAFARTDADKIWLQTVYGFKGRVQVWLEWIQYSLADILTEAEKPVPLADAARIADPRPILLVTAGKVEDELHAAQYIQQHSPNNVVIWTVPEAGHTQGLATKPVEWESTVISFLENALSRQH
ncbi:MAG: alpha/beta fold hydrolase [Dehalococcoidales bacterium]|nr:alpha/beta fold hydrolase [Dehalococcoidales bacterium]